MNMPNMGPLNSIRAPEASSGSASAMSKGILPLATYADTNNVITSKITDALNRLVEPNRRPGEPVKYI